MSDRKLLASFGNFDGAQFSDYDPETEDYDPIADGIGPYEASINEEIDNRVNEQSVFSLLGLPVPDYEEYLDLQ
jgi:hypothetical protein